MGAAVKHTGGGVEPYFGRRRLTGVRQFLPQPLLNFVCGNFELWESEYRGKFCYFSHGDFNHVLTKLSNVFRSYAKWENVILGGNDYGR